MNKIDYENIRKELESRKVKFKEGGELSIECIQRQSNEVLEEILKSEHECSVLPDYVAELMRIVDETFAKYGTDKDNVIVLQSVNDMNKPELESTQILEKINFTHKSNEIVRPIGSDDRFFDFDFEFDMCVSDLIVCLDELREPDIVDVFKNDKNICGDKWHGVIAITRNYEYIYFVISEDGVVKDQKINLIRKF